MRDRVEGGSRLFVGRVRRPAGLALALILVGLLLSRAEVAWAAKAGAQPEARGVSAAASGRTVVSLEFDDGWADAYAARGLLSGLNLHATFFVMSGYLGAPRRLSASQVQALAADGNEIGGHTIDHPHLLSLTPDEQAREICNDRAALLGDGF